jgi:peptidoglycan-N-acetylglucosamine deacetylase
MNQINYLLILLLSCSILACDKAQKASQIEETIQANQKSQTHIDWETSEFHTSKLFNRWLFERAKPDDICSSLVTRTGLELTLFEEEFKKPEYQALISPCAEELKAKLQEYWASLEYQPEQISSNFQFQQRVEYRDFSQGYATSSGNLKPKDVLLTFDDGPHPKHTDEILRTLKNVGAPAVFFHMGRNVHAYPDVVRRVAAGGHGVGSHTYNHICLPFKDACAKNDTNKGHKYTYSEAVREIVEGHRAVQSILGWVDPFFRFPYGEGSPDLKKFVLDKKAGTFFWSVDSEDWKTQGPEKVVETTLNQLRSRKGGILLFHDVHRRTSVMLPQLLKELYFDGFNIVLMKVKDEKAARSNSLLANAPL